MKKYIKYLSFCLLAGVGLSSCDTGDDGYREDPVDVGGYAYLQDRSITVLDQNETLTINLMSDDNVQFESVAIEDGDGNQIATATVSGETATFNTSDLFEDEDGELTEVTGSFPLTIVSTLSNGMEVRDPATISVGHAVTLSGPGEVQYMDPRNPDDNVLSYSVAPFGATVDDLTLEYRIGEDGTYQVDDITEIDLAAAVSEDGGEIDLTQLDYEAYGLEPGDELYYRFTATSGALTDVVETSIEITPQAFTDGGNGTLANDENKLDLMTGETIDVASEGGDIVFDGTVAAPGFTAVEGSGIQFVETTEEIEGALDAMNTFEAGTSVTTVSDVSNGDVFLYKVSRDIEDEDGNVTTVTHYGVIEIGAVTQVDGETVTIEVSSTEGVAVSAEAETETEV